MVRRTKEEAEETRLQILEAAELMFHDKGVAHTSLADIAKAAGVTRGAIYWHFQNRADLFRAMLDRLIWPLESLALATEDENEPDPLGRMRTLLVKILQRVELDPQARRTMEILYFRCEYTEELSVMKAEIIRLSQDCDSRIAKALENAAKKGQLPGDLNFARAAVYLHAMIDGLQFNWLLNPSYSLATDAELMVDTVLQSLSHAPTLKK